MKIQKGWELCVPEAAGRRWTVSLEARLPGGGNSSGQGCQGTLRRSPVPVFLAPAWATVGYNQSVFLWVSSIGLGTLCG